MSSTTQQLTAEELHHLLAELPEWAIEDGKLIRHWTHADFARAMDFVNRVAQLAEQHNHHPDIDIRYNRVKLSLVSHDAGGITPRDATLARLLSAQF